MPPHLLETKLYTPQPRRGVVSRSRLHDLLDRGGQAKLTLVSAPPGFGKSTLLADWAAGRAAAGRPVAWVSLDQADNDPASFWGYVVASLQRALPDAAAAVLPDPSQGPTPAMLTGLVNALAEADGEPILVLDDYHAIERTEIHEGIEFLLEHLPPQAHLVIAGRSDPPLPLARLRARGELVEVRAADLRFTADEAAIYLNDSMGLALASEEVEVLERRTEGWIAALQLAALSMEGRDDRASFIAAFAGDHRYVVDYLVEEVLERQPERIRRFMLETSVLDRMSGPLCDAVTGRDAGRATLEALARANLFVIPLDDRRDWYRYHHLFSQLLRAKLRDEQPELEPELHRRASVWFQEHADDASAIQHALAAREVERAADLIELAAHALRASRQELTLRGWLDALPDHVFDVRPVLAIAHVGALLATGELGGVERRLASAEQWVSASRDAEARAAAAEAGMVVRHAHALDHLPAAIALYRAALARMRGDVDATIEHARTALEAAGDAQPLERGGAAGMLALAQWTRGDLDAAHASWSLAARSLEEGGHLADVLGCSLGMADIRAEQGRLGEARRTLEDGLRLGMAGGVPLRGTADMHVALADLHRERNDLDAARQHLEAAHQLGESLGLPQHPHRLRVAMARMRLAEGSLGEAVELLDAAEQRYDADFFPEVHPIAALRARAWLAQGRLRDALDWAERAGLASSNEPAYEREFEQATLVRLLLAQGIAEGAKARIGAAVNLAERLLDAARTGGRSASAIDILVALSLARHAQDDAAGAAAALDDALSLAAAEGFARIFLDEGPRMVALLENAARSAPSAYAAELVVGLGRPAAISSTARPLVDPLSQRELEVLRLLQSDLDGPDIARELYVSLNTLRTHTRNIYAKLGVGSRRGAISRATELGLLAGGDKPT